MIGDFHFIRPLWLVALIPLGILVWTIYRRQNAAQTWKGIVAPHLLPFLLSGERQRSWLSPLLLIGIGWLVSVISIAGPTWKREPAPFADDTAALAIVVKATPSMETEDVEPSRLERSTQKIHDLLKQRPGGRTALIAYAGTAHRVMPVTTDGGIIDTFAQALDPKVMPEDGDAAADALRLAEKALEGSGSILWIADSIAPEQNSALAAWRKGSRVPVQVLAPLLPGAEFDTLKQSARVVDATFVPLSADDSDVSVLARAAKFSTAITAERSDRWQESGYWLTPLIALLLSPFFRKGWMTRTASQV